MDETLLRAVELFNEGRYSEFQEAIEEVAANTRAASERQFYTVLRHLAEALHQLGNEQLAKSEELMLAALRRLDEFVPRFRSLNVEALRDDFRRVLVELREARAGRKAEIAPSRLPRLRVLGD